MSIVTLDADQAFEACNAGAVLRAWDSVQHVIRERIGSRVVLLGKQEYEWNANRLEQIKAGFDCGSFRVSQCVAVLGNVDDLISLRYCRRCLVEFAKKSYSIPVSRCDL